MNNETLPETSSREPLKCLNPAYSLVYPLIERAVSALVETYVAGNCPSLPAQIAKFDLATRVYYDRSSRFPYVRETLSTSPETLRQACTRAALIGVITENLSVLLVRDLTASEHAVAMVILSHLDAELLEKLLQQSYVNTLDYPRAKTLIIENLSRRHYHTLWQAVDEKINQIR